MKIGLENRKKVAVEFPISTFKRKNRVEEGGALRLGIKREHESTKARAHKVMRGRMAPSTVPTLV
jgi:hypothetical protein